MVHGEIDEFNQRRRQYIPLRLEIVCRATSSVAKFNKLLDPLIKTRIECLEGDYHVEADRTGRNGCYNSSNPIAYWRIHKHPPKKLNRSWKERLIGFLYDIGFLSGDYVGKIVTESVLLDRLRLRFYILEKYWKDLENAVTAISSDMLSGSEGFDVITGIDSRQQLKPMVMGDEIVVLFLFLTVAPSPDERLRLDKEVREIVASFRTTDLRDKYNIEQCWAVRVSDIQSALLRYRPHIVHFSGHGTEAGELIVENDFGDCAPISPVGLGRLFGILQDRVMCVVLNACYSEIQAKEIAKHVDYVIGMKADIDDDSAIIFSKAFYEALGYGKGFIDAFELGKNAMELHNQADFKVPVLIEHISTGAKPHEG